MSQRIAVIGAGMAGLTCAHRIAESGHSVTVFDKGRTIGGRLATRESGEYAFDHGAPAVSARRPAFRALMERLVEAGSASVTDLPFEQSPPDGASYVGMPAMNRLLSPFAQGLDIRSGFEVIGLVAGRDGWTLGVKGRAPETGFSTVLFAVPAPQAKALLLPAAEDLADGLDAARYRPVMTALAAMAEPLPVQQDVLCLDDPIVEFAIRNDAKPGRPSQVQQWVIHASQAWSVANRQAERPDIGERLVAAFLDHLGLLQQTPVFLRGHRWQYARVLTPIGRSHGWDPHRSIGLAGDYWRGDTAEHAFESGLMLAEAVLA